MGFYLRVMLWLPIVLQAAPFPISFSIPECKVVRDVPKKDQDFAFLIPGRMETYIYQDEASYYKEYQRSYFALTCKKGGWDCMRHYEILANGCIPYFPDLHKCPLTIMPFLPRALIHEAMNLPGVTFLRIDHKKFDRDKYRRIVQQLLAWTRKYLTTRAMAQYVLQQAHYMEGTILYLPNKPPGADYLCDTVLIGLKEVLGTSVIDFPKVEFIYQNYSGNVDTLWGKGMSYTKILSDAPVDRSNIEERIRNQEFSLIIYGSVHRGQTFWDTVHACYPQEKIFYICGEDDHQCAYAHLPNLFLREQ